MRKAHRFVAVFALIFALYVASTGLFIQALDLRALLAGAPASDPTMQAIRVGQNGPPNFQVIREEDYAAAPLPPGLDLQSAMARVASSARGTAGGAGPRFIELRNIDGKAVGQV